MRNLHQNFNCREGRDLPQGDFAMKAYNFRNEVWSTWKSDDCDMELL